MRPMTYFLQETMINGQNAVMARLDAGMDNRPCFVLKILPEKELGHAMWDNGDMTSRYLDAFILAGQATGVYHRKEEASLEKRLHTCDPYEHPFMASRMLITSVDLYLQESSVTNKQRVDDLIVTISRHLIYEEDYAYYFKAPDGWNSIDNAVFGAFEPYTTYPIGGIILALARYLENDAAPNAEDMIRKLVKFVLCKSGMFTSEGHYFGHTHSGGVLTAAVGIARWAVHTGDTALLKQMRGVFDWTVKYSSSWGWVPDGLGSQNASSETCSITDAIHLGLIMARHVDAAYYETIERYVRNQLIENQFRKNEINEKAFGLKENTAIANAFYGSWASWSLPNCLDNSLEMIEGCCLGSGIRGCSLVWDYAIEKRQDVVSVNMAFSRNSPWLEVISYQPYQGRVDLVLHDAPQLQIRIPSWVNDSDITVSINGRRQTDYVVNGKYLVFNGLIKGDTVSITYPLKIVETSENVNGTVYQLRWRGDTVTDISPKGLTYPIYDRRWMETMDAPMVDDTPYVNQHGGPVHW